MAEASAKPGEAFADGRRKFAARLRAIDHALDVHGWSEERETCGGCGRVRATRARCHCGEIMVRDVRRSWYAAGMCPACAYTPHWPEEYRAGELYPIPGRPVHACARPVPAVRYRIPRR